jgi:hypothetical protein
MCCEHGYFYPWVPIYPIGTPLHAHPRLTDSHRCGSIPVAMDRFASPSTYSYPPSTDSRPSRARPSTPPACPPSAIAPPLARLLCQLACRPALLLAAGRRSPDFWRPPAHLPARPLASRRLPAVGHRRLLSGARPPAFRPALLLAAACPPPTVARLLYGTGID